MLIDAHQHTDWIGHDCHAVVKDMDERGIDRAWLLTWEVPDGEFSPSYYGSFAPGDTGLPLRNILHACERYPDRFVAGYAPDPRRPDAIERLEAAVKMHNVRVYGELKLRICLDDPDVVRVFRRCGELGLPIVLHIDIPAAERPKLPARDYWYCVDIDRLEKVLLACPQTNFIGHAPGFWRHVSGDGYTAEGSYPKGEVTAGGRVPELLAKYANLYADISAGSGYTALTRPPEGRGRAFAVEHQDKLLYGRDEFTSRHHDLLKSWELPAAAYEKIAFRNALKLVPL